MARPSTKKTITPSKYIISVLGSDEGAIKLKARELAQEFTPKDAGDFGVDAIDGAAENVAAAVSAIHKTVEALYTLPFFGGSKLVWLKNANFLSDNVVSRSNSVLEALEHLSEVLSAGLPDEVKFLMSAIDVDKRRSFYKLLSKLGPVQIFDKIDSSKSGWEEEAIALAQEYARELKLSFSPDAAELFAMLTGGDSHQMRSELEKIALYIEGERKEIRIEDVRQLVPLTKQGVIFEVSNALIQKDLKRSLELITRLLQQGETGISILFATIIPTVRNLLLVKDLQERFNLPKVHISFQFPKTLERLPEENIAHLPRKKDGTLNPFALGFAAVGAPRFELATLKRGLEKCLEANVRLVTTQLDSRLVLEQLLVHLMA